MKFFSLKTAIVTLSLLWGSHHSCLAMDDPIQVEQAHQSAHQKPTLEIDTATTNLSSVYKILDDVCKDYSKVVFTKLAPPVLTLFSLLALIALIWRICILGLLKKKFEGGEAAKLLIIFSLLTFFMKNSDSFFDYFYQPLKSMTLEVTRTVVSITTPGAGQISDINGLLKAVDTQFIKIENHARMLVRQSYFNLSAIFNGFFIMIIYKLTACLFIFYIADLSFGFMAVTALGPIFLATYFFKQTKSYSERAIQLAVCCCLTLIFAGLSVGVTLRLTQTLNVDNSDSLVHTNGTWEILCIGFLCLMFMRRAPQLAASITGASDSGTAGMTAGLAMTVASMAKTVSTLGYGKIAAAFKATDLISNAGGKK